MVHKTQGKSLQTFLIFPTRHPTYCINIGHATLIILTTFSLNFILGYLHLTTFSLISQNQNSKMYQPYVSTPNKHTKEQSNPRNIGTDVDYSEVITDVVPLSMVPGHATPIRKPRTSASRKGKPSKVSASSSPYMVASDVRSLEPSTAVKKPLSMTSMYLDPINVEPNVDDYAKKNVVPEVVGNVETSKSTNKP